MKKITLLTVCLASSIICGNTNAAEKFFLGTKEVLSFTEESAWKDSLLPMHLDNVNIIGKSPIKLNSGEANDLKYNLFAVCDGTTLEMESGALIKTNIFIVGWHYKSAPFNAFCTLNSGAAVDCKAVYLGTANPKGRTGTLILNGGELKVSEKILIGSKAINGAVIGTLKIIGSKSQISSAKDTIEIGSTKDTKSMGVIACEFDDKGISPLSTQGTLVIDTKYSNLTIDLSKYKFTADTRIPLIHYAKLDPKFNKFTSVKINGADIQSPKHKLGNGFSVSLDYGKGENSAISIVISKE